jgi:hypothetical protein
MNGIAGRTFAVAAAIVSTAIIPACGLVGSGNSSPVTESGHTIRDQCDRTLEFFGNNLGITDVSIGYASINPDDKIGMGATCTVRKASLVGVGGTRLRAMLPSESEPASIKGDPNYIEQPGYDERVWLNDTDGSVRIFTTVNGWQGSLDFNVDQINNVSTTSGEEPNFEASADDVRAAAEFLIELTRDMTS